ncbi:hypothetical protein HMPREF9151_01213 [Hoylesella saccharolytica F0055]|uniref:Uncharacterized protein n=1 Tax=Hoylesella saccharolytica F0055 TaxID=1127699 RepID=L1NBJ2_9BACT|nr:hypothetical protein HMPREF9151_01213 [Hoylesella saccharolytica F0055]
MHPLTIPLFISILAFVFQKLFFWVSKAMLLLSKTYSFACQNLCFYTLKE